jgi:hypothetical protein
MKKMIVTKRLFGLIPVRSEIDKPHIVNWRKGGKLVRQGDTIVPTSWKCEGEGITGYGITPQGAWNDWAMWGLI